MNDTKTSEASEGATTLRTSELLRKAADEIRRRGWWQGDFAQPYVGSGDEGDWYQNCPVCLWGAVNAAAQDGDPWWRTRDERRDLGRAAQLVVKAGGGAADDEGDYHVASWNDTEGRTVEEVLGAFEKAAQAAEADGD